MHSCQIMKLEDRRTEIDIKNELDPFCSGNVFYFSSPGNYCMYHVITRNFDLITMHQDISQWEKKQDNLRSCATWILLVSFSPM